MAPTWAPPAWLLGLIHAHASRQQQTRGSAVRSTPECGSAVAQPLLLRCSQQGSSVSAAAACSLALGVAWATSGRGGDRGSRGAALTQAAQCFAAAVSKSSGAPVRCPADHSTKGRVVFRAPDHRTICLQTHSQCCALYNSALALQQLGQPDAAISTLEALTRVSLQHPECGVRRVARRGGWGGRWRAALSHYVCELRLGVAGPGADVVACLGSRAAVRGPGALAGRGSRAAGCGGRAGVGASASNVAGRRCRAVARCTVGTAMRDNSAAHACAGTTGRRARS